MSLHVYWAMMCGESKRWGFENFRTLCENMELFDCLADRTCCSLRQMFVKFSRFPRLFLPPARSVMLRVAIRNGQQISAPRPKPWFTRPSRCLWDFTTLHSTSARFSEVNMAGVSQTEEHTTCTTMSPDAT